MANSLCFPSLEKINIQIPVLWPPWLSLMLNFEGWFLVNLKHVQANVFCGKVTFSVMFVHLFKGGRTTCGPIASWDTTPSSPVQLHVIGPPYSPITSWDRTPARLSMHILSPIWDKNMEKKLYRKCFFVITFHVGVETCDSYIRLMIH